MAGGALAMKELMSSDSDRVDVDEGDSSDTELERPAKSIQDLKWMEYHTFCFPLINGLMSFSTISLLPNKFRIKFQMKISERKHGWHSVKNARLPPIWPGFKSRP